ncbi:MAG: hypothetical protein PHF35_01075 [Candidatus Moranbacteria bacterium]|nr:hypothetical protein [Candidatus Moranbacteria bacterium]
MVKATTPEQRARLVAAGFLRVDGLKTDGGYIIEPRVSHLGRHDSNNGKTVIVTEGGEVWLAVYSSPTSLPDWERRGSSLRAELYRELCPEGTGANVPCSNGEELNFRDVLCRLANPDWIPDKY